MLHGRLLRISELDVVSGAVLEQQRIADLEQLHRAESAALAAQTRAQTEARAIDLVPKLPIPVHGELWRCAC